MTNTKRLNGLPNNIGESYLSTVKYYSKAYMADWLNSVALKTKIYEIKIDIINDEVTPSKCQIKALNACNDEFRSLLKTVLKKEGFESNFIAEANMLFQIRSRKGRNIIIICDVELIDNTGKLYTNKIPIKGETFEKPFEPFNLFDKRRYL